MLRTHWNFVGENKLGLEKDSLKIQGSMERVSIMSEERCLHGSLTEFVGQVEDLKDQFRKMEDDIYQSELEGEVPSLVVRGIVEEKTKWEENLAKEEETLHGQRDALDV